MVVHYTSHVGRGELVIIIYYFNTPFLVAVEDTGAEEEIPQQEQSADQVRRRWREGGRRWREGGVGGGREGGREDQVRRWRERGRDGGPGEEVEGRREEVEGGRTR